MKEYIVRVNKEITDEFIQGMSKERADSGYGDTSVYASEDR